MGRTIQRIADTAIALAILLSVVAVTVICDSSEAGNKTDAAGAGHDLGVVTHKETRWLTVKARSSWNFPGDHLQVFIEVSVLDIEYIDGKKEQMGVHLQLRQSWKDSTVVGDIPNETSSEDAQLFSSSIEKSIWIPETIITSRQGSDFRMHRSCQMCDQQNKQVRLKYNARTHELEKLDRMFAIIKCDSMDFSRYPFDYQKCVIRLQLEAAFQNHKIEYKWNRSHKGQHVVKADDVIAPFQVVHIGRRQASLSTVRSDGTPVPLELEIEVRRLWSTYLQRFYLPMTTFVLCSLLSLWLVYPKISFIMNFMNIVAIHIFLAIWDLHSDIPKLSYCTALDVYSFICLAFIVLILLLNVYILFYIKSDESDAEDEPLPNTSFQSPQDHHHSHMYFLPKREELRSFRVSQPDPFQKTIHPRTSGSSPAVIGLEALRQHHQAAQMAAAHPHNYNHDGFMDTPDITQRRGTIITLAATPTVDDSVKGMSWSCMKAGILDKIRRSGHSIFLFSFISLFLLYWTILLALYYGR